MYFSPYSESSAGEVASILNWLLSATVLSAVAPQHEPTSVSAQFACTAKMRIEFGPTKGAEKRVGVQHPVNSDHRS